MNFLDLYDKPLTPSLEKGYIINCTPEQFKEAKSIELFTIDKVRTSTQKSAVILNIQSSTQLRDALFAALHKELELHIKEAYIALLKIINYTESNDKGDLFQITNKEYKALIDRHKIFNKYDVREPKVSQIIYDKILSKVTERLKYEDIISRKNFTIPNFTEFIDIIRYTTYIDVYINILKAKTQCNLIRNIRSIYLGLTTRKMTPWEINYLRDLGYVLGFEEHNRRIDDKLFLDNFASKIPDKTLLKKYKGDFSIEFYKLDEDLSNEIKNFIQSNISTYINQELKKFDQSFFLMFTETKTSIKEGKKILKQKLKELKKTLTENDFLVDISDSLSLYFLRGFEYKEVLAFINDDIIEKYLFIEKIQSDLKPEIDLEIKKCKINRLNEKLKLISEKNKNLKSGNNTSPTNKKENTNIKFDKFENLFDANNGCDKDFVLEMLEVLKITRGGHSILTNRKKSRLRGFVEALVEYHIIPDDNIDNLCEIFANQIGMEYKARLKCSDISEKTKKSTIDYIKKHH